MFNLYIDPGTGSMLFAVIIGIASTLFFLAQKFWIKLKFIFSSGRVKEDVNAKKKPLVIFGEDGRYWNIFHSVCDELENRGVECEYYTMDKNDPSLSCDYKHIHPSFIGEGNKAFAKLNMLKANVLFTTTPGLDVFQWKRSPNVDKYLHIYHAVDEGAGYRMFGMDFFDSILMASQFQVDTVRSLEKMRREAPKDIQIVGSPYLDDLDRKAKNYVADKKNPEDKVVLLAPSWGESSILSKFGDEMLDALVKTGYHIIVRPHPQSKIVEKEVLDPLLEKYPESDQIEWDNNNDGFPSLSRADIMISDFSSVVFDFALIFNKPVIFADTDFDKSPYDAAWFDEDLWRLRVLDQMGVSLKQEDFPRMKELIKELTENDRFGEGREKLREQLWAKRGESAKNIADYLEEQLKAG
ncbi:MAG: CDP-glycerol glycerophosphotransferase family protein [Clostridiales bacterium]|nr:CDP-glycerol glycerophosphotransferase family protein [Clostridiales bacterium]